MAPRHDVQAEPDLVREQGAFVVHRIGPETYSVVLEIEGKAGGRFITELNRATCKVNRSPIQAARRASLESPHSKTHLLQICAQV